MKLKDIKDSRNQVTQEGSKTVEKKMGRKLEEVKIKKIKVDERNKNAFKKSLKTVRQQIRQFEGKLPAELIVTGYKKGNNTTMNSNNQSNETTLKENPPSL